MLPWQQDTCILRCIPAYLEFLPRPVSLPLPGVPSLVPKVEEGHLQWNQWQDHCLLITPHDVATHMQVSATSLSVATWTCLEALITNSELTCVCTYIHTCFCVCGPLWLRNIFSTEQPKPHTSAAVRVAASSSSGVRVATSTYYRERGEGARGIGVKLTSNTAANTEVWAHI